MDSVVRLLFAVVLLAAPSLTTVARAAEAVDGQPSAGELEVHFLDVGQGEAAVVRTPGGRIILIDAGPVARGDDVAAYLRGLGVTRVEAIAPSHAHADHTGGP